MSTSDNERNNEDKDQKITYKELAQKSGEEATIGRRIAIIVLILIVLAVTIGGYLGYQYIKDGLTPVDPDNTETTEVTIPLGSSTSNIATILEENNIISNSTIFRFYIKFNNIADFQAGDYQFSSSMTLKEITDELQTGVVEREPVFRVTIPEGKTIQEIASIYEERANIDAEEFTNTVENEDFIQELITRYPSILSDEILNEEIRTPLEGYLFAATYEFYEDNPSVETIVTSMLDKTESVINNYYEEIEAKEGWTVHDIITMASLVEEEARNEDERKKIAGVFYNRLEADMMLQTDPTVIYAHGEHLERVLYKHLEIESPYNTYQNVGLPVGPISNFGESSLVSVLNHDDTDAMYFVAAPDGTIYYSRTLEEHQSLVNEHLNRE